jgi:zinc transport system substrate-binding protein
MNQKQKALITITIIAVICLAAATTLFATQPKTNNLKIVATFYPLAYMSQEIGGDHVEVTQLVPDNTEIHSWEPSSSDIVTTNDADIIICNGAGADHWMEDDIIPSLSTTKTRTIVETTSGLELLLGTPEEEEEEEHDHGIYDPHTWISPYMAKLQGEKIYNAIVQKDPDHESYYTQRWNTLKSQLEQLDSQYSTQLANKGKTEIFVSHAAFGYLAYRYNFNQTGVIGLSADEQPSAATIANIVNTMEEHQIYTVYVDPIYSTDYANTLKTEIQQQTGHEVTILELYLILGQTDNQNMIEQMQANLNNLKIGLEASP